MKPTPNTDLNTIGTFHPGKVAGKRVLVFVHNETKSVGVSKRFSRLQAFKNSEKREVKLNGDALTSLLKSKGFPVTSGDESIDDRTALEIMEEISHD